MALLILSSPRLFLFVSRPRILWKYNLSKTSMHRISTKSELWWRKIFSTKFIYKDYIYNIEWNKIVCVLYIWTTNSLWFYDMYIYKTFSKILMKNETADLGSSILVRNEILNFSYGKKRRCLVDYNTRREEIHKKFSMIMLI